MPTLKQAWETEIARMKSLPPLTERDLFRVFSRMAEVGSTYRAGLPGCWESDCRGCLDHAPLQSDDSNRDDKP